MSRTLGDRREEPLRTKWRLLLQPLFPKWLPEFFFDTNPVFGSVKEPADLMMAIQSIAEGWNSHWEGAIAKVLAAPLAPSGSIPLEYRGGIVPTHIPSFGYRREHLDGHIPLSVWAETHGVDLQKLIEVPPLERALLRPHDYFDSPIRRQWEIDRGLGITDWDPSDGEVQVYRARGGPVSSLGVTFKLRTKDMRHKMRLFLELVRLRLPNVLVSNRDAGPFSAWVYFGDLKEDSAQAAVCLFEDPKHPSQLYLPTTDLGFGEAPDEVFSSEEELVERLVQVLSC